MRTHTLAEWAAMVDIAATGYASFSVFYFVLVDAAPADFNPRPAVRRVIDTGRADRLLVATANAKHDVRLSLRDAPVWVAALLTLLTLTPEGAR